MVSAVPTIPKPWLVQKYGGTSLGKLLGTICTDIVPSYLQGNRVAVVCSALSGTTKATGTTSLLLQCISLAESSIGFLAQLHQTVDLIANNHFKVLEQHLSTADSTHTELCHETRARVSDECESLRRYLLAAQIIGECSSRAKDRVISLGEKLASIIVAAVLAANGIPSQVIVLDDLVETVFGTDVYEQRAQFDNLYSQFYQHLAEEVGRRIRGVGNNVPVITGFFGIMPDSLVKTVGRGYSDLCAAMCALGIRAAELQIWKEVDGIFTADPRKVPSARLLSTVTAEEAAELTYYGSETPLSTPPSPSTTPSTSTTPSPEDDKIKLEQPRPTSGFMLEHGYHGERQERRIPTALTVKDAITLVNVACNRNTTSRGFLTNVLARVEESNATVDLVTTSERSISLAVQAPGDAGVEEKRIEAGLEKFGKVVFTRNMSIVTVVGHKMRNMVGIASMEAVSSLACAKINIYLVSQGASEISISLVVRAEDALLAMNMIHGKVLGIPTHWEQENNFIKGTYFRLVSHAGTGL
ncbi:Aspartokinase [Sporothrix curviconia]|uniref:aspartate kinase n=1 Tax=Sporothrix curviconia TaxID=1260050 RepID=A0ABP0CYE3_9PEZI